jgi:uncharacterized protein (TIGR02453 family)
MPEPDSLITDAKAFYAGLDANNNRDWWTANKSTYETKLKVPALALLDDLATKLQGLTGHPVTPKLFRPHRDVRFSKDKTPYNTHLHMMWSVAGGGRQDPVFYFGIGLDYVSAGAGLMGFEGGVLDDWRKMVDLDGDRIAGIVASVEKAGFALWEPGLKRVPPPYDKSHPHERLLRMKGLVASRELGGMGPLPDRLMAAFTACWPIDEMLIGIA